MMKAESDSEGKTSTGGPQVKRTIQFERRKNVSLPKNSVTEFRKQMQTRSRLRYCSKERLQLWRRREEFNAEASRALGREKMDSAKRNADAHKDRQEAAIRSMTASNQKDEKRVLSTRSTYTHWHLIATLSSRR
jgi:hypothetical protein